MRKFYSFIFFILLSLSQAWALNAKIEGDQWKDNRTWSGSHVTFRLDGQNSKDGKHLDVAKNIDQIVTWTVDEGYIIHVTAIKIKIGHSLLAHGGTSCDIYLNGEKVWNVGTTTGSEKEFTGYNLGENGSFTLKFSTNADLYYIDITYTITPITYYMAFHGNGGEGTMANQAIQYDQTVALSSNAFTQNYTFTYDANGGQCDESSASAQYTFEGWATSANGAVVYTNGQQMHNLTHENNRVFDLYAVWTPQTITLPAATNGTMLFNGWFDENDQYVGKAGDVVTPTQSLDLTAKWATALTPMFVLDKPEIAIDGTAKLTMDNVTTPTVTIAPQGIVSYDEQTGVITGLAAGTVTITISQEADGLILAKEEELELTVTKKTPSLSYLLNGIDQTTVIIVQGETATVSFEKESDTTVVVTTLSGGICASYSDGVLTAGEIGIATFRATLPETDTYFGTYKDFQVDVRKNPVHLPLAMSIVSWHSSTVKVESVGSNSWDGQKGITLGDGTGGGFNYDDKYIILHFEGVPDKMTFELATTESPAGGATKVEWYIQESSTQAMNGDKIWTSTHTGTDFSATQTVELQPTTRYVKLCYSGNFGGHIRNLQISELKYVQDPEPTSIDFGAAVIYTGEVSGTINVNWCNIAPLNVTSSNPRFAVTPSVFGNYDQLGTQEITVSYTHTGEVCDEEGDITISNGNPAYDKTIHVHAATTKRAQTIVWNAELEATNFAMNVGERYPDENVPVAAATANGARVTFTSSNSEIIEVVADTMLVAHAEGTAEIIAYQAGDGEYAEVSDTKLFTVSELQKQSIIWDQNLYGLLTTESVVYMTAYATSEMDIEYSSSNENVVETSGSLLIIVGEGEAVITATQPGGVDENGVEWLPVSTTNYVIVRNPASQCNEMALSVGSLTLQSGHLTQEYDLVGAPTTLTFSAKHGTKSNGAWGQKPNYAALMVDQYTKVDGVWTWQNIYNTVVGTDATGSGTLTLDESATKLRFRTTESETEHTITDIRVPRKKYLRTDVANVELEVETNSIWQQTITIGHSNIDLLTVSSKQGLLTLSAKTLGEGCGDFGDDAFTASFTPTVKYVDYYDTIVITDGKEQPSTIEIPVHLYATGLNQYIQNFNLPASCLNTAVLAPFEATATSGLEVTYFTSDESIAYVEDNQLVILAVGTVDVTAFQGGDEIYNLVTVTKTLVIEQDPDAISDDPVTPTGLDQLEMGVKAAKILRNGVVYILRGDQLYTITGQRIE